MSFDSDQHIKHHHNFVDGQPSEIVIRTGEAPKVYDPEQVKIQGVITAPAEYLSKRDCPKESTHVVFSKQQRMIRLVVNESSRFQTVISGVLTKHEFLSKLHINSTQGYSITDLGKTLRYARRYFAQPEQHTQLIVRLRNFTAKITTTTQQENDMQGNKKHSFEAKVDEFAKTNELGFTLRLPLFDGTDKVNIPIRIEIDIVNGQVILFLVCDELEEMEDELVEKIFSEQKEVFKDYVCLEC